MKRPSRNGIIYAAVLAFAALLRFVKLGTPKSLVFDELYYVRDAWSQLQNGYATKWPNDDPVFNAQVAQTYLQDPNYVAHPPLGKWMISLGMMLFGVEDGYGWRAATAFFGVLTVATVMLIAWRLTKNGWITAVTGLLLAVDGVHVTLSRVSLLDGHLTFLVTLGALFIVLDHEWSKNRWRKEHAKLLHAKKAPGTVSKMWILRPWLLAAAATFGFAAAVKWSGAYALAGFALWVATQDFLARKSFGTKRPALGTVLQTLLQMPLLAAVTALSYLATWSGWIFTSGGWDRQAGSWPSVLWGYHTELLAWHRELQDPHPYAAHPLSWSFGVRPTAMLFETSDGMVSTITPIPNILITWGGFVAVVFLTVLLIWVAFKHPKKLVSHPLVAVAAVATLGYWSGIVPWILTPSRSAVFQFYAVVMTPFAALALATVLAALTNHALLPAQIRDTARALARKRSINIFIVSAVLLSLWMWPMWSGMLQPEVVWRSHIWLPGWY